jgi:hypothetical protein
MIKVVKLEVGFKVENENEGNFNEFNSEIVNKVNEGNFNIISVENVVEDLEIVGVTENDLIYKSLEIKEEIERLMEFDGSELIEEMYKLLELRNEYDLLKRNMY